MKKKLIVILSTVFCLSMILLNGCSSKAGTEVSPGSVPAEKTSAKGAALMKEWGAKYPVQYDSFYSDYDLVKPDGKVHGHSNLVNKIALRHGPARPAIGSCMLCKSGDASILYEEYGDELFAMPYFSAEGGIEGDMAMWNCNTCHSDMNNPPGTLAASSVFWDALAVNLNKDMDTRNQVCGQCHNALEPYRYLVGLTQDSIYDFDAYKYGFDADAWLKALLENANYSKGTVVEDAICYKDEETKIVDIGVYHPDIEMYQNSTHQSLGLTCVSCHMTEETNMEGESYTRHAASLSPLASETTLEYCLTCHKSQGIENTQEMVLWVREQQAAIGVPEAELLQKMDVLNNLILEATKEGNVNEGTLDKARWAYTTANVYYKWQRGLTASPGIKVAMYTSEIMLQYINRGIVAVDEAIALLN